MMTGVEEGEKDIGRTKDNVVDYEKERMLHGFGRGDRKVAGWSGDAPRGLDDYSKCFHGDR